MSLSDSNPAAEVRDFRLWYRQPARRWEEALPIGCGRLGAMVFGGIEFERIQFNEETLWTGRPRDYLRSGARAHLPDIRRLIFAGETEAAADVVRRHFLSDPVRQKAYQPFGDLRFVFPDLSGVSEYHRELDLSTAIARTGYVAGGVRFEREVLASHPDGVIAIRLTKTGRSGFFGGAKGAKTGQSRFFVRLTSAHLRSAARRVSADTVAVAGQVQDNLPPHDLGLRFEARLRAVVEGGTAGAEEDGTIGVDGADAVTLLLVAATSFVRFDDISADPAERCAISLEKLRHRPYADIRAEHIADHRRLFGACRLDLGRTPAADQPTDLRLARLVAGVEATERAGGDIAAVLAHDPALVALYFQWGRYLLIASSRAGGQPANLQGIWNELPDPPWESKFTTNINLQMNYWLAGLTGLAECETPLFDLVDDLRTTGAKVAREHYGARGWVLHHNTDLWRGAMPINNIDGLWPTGGAWLCWHLWEHYRFTLDRTFLADRAYPAMRESCRFFLDTLVTDPRTGFLVTCPSHSPEQGPLCAGPAMDLQLLRALFDSTRVAARELDVDADLCDEIADARARLAPDRIGAHGQLQEWQVDIDQPGNTHRHLSPLWGLHPGTQFTPEAPALFAAARKLLDWRGDGSTGWSYAWRVAMHARTGAGNPAARQLALQLARKTFDNLFDMCGPFQVDGNFGVTAGIVEMLLQSHRIDAATGNPILDLLPALPASWAEGNVCGLRARGQFVVDLTWRAGGLQAATVRSDCGGCCVVRNRDATVKLQLDRGETVTLDGALEVSR
jgi:alpha-L-fucosidase 2